MHTCAEYSEYIVNFGLFIVTPIGLFCLLAFAFYLDYLEDK